MNKIILTLLCSVFVANANEGVKHLQSILKVVPLTDLPPLIEGASSNVEEIDLPVYDANAINHISSQTLFHHMKDPKSISETFIKTCFDELQNWAQHYIDLSDPKFDGNDPLFPVLTTETLACYYLPMAYLAMTSHQSRLAVSQMWSNMLGDSLKTYIQLYNLPKQTHSERRIYIDGYADYELGVMATQFVQAITKMRLCNLPDVTPKYKTVDKKSNNLGVNQVGTNSELRTIIDDNNTLHDLAGWLVEQTPESMTLVDAMTLQDVYLTWSEAHDGAVLQIRAIREIVENLIKKNIRLSSGDPFEDSDGIRFDDYLQEFTDEAKRVCLTVRIKRPCIDTDYVGLSDLFGDD